MSDNFGYLNEYPEKKDLGLDDKLVGLNELGETNLFPVDVLIKDINSKIKGGDITFRKIDLGNVSGDVVTLINNGTPFDVLGSEIILVLRNEPVNGNELYILKATIGRYGLASRQITSDDVILIEREYKQLLIDTAMSDSSVGAVSNKVIKEYIDGKQAEKANFVELRFRKNKDVNSYPAINVLDRNPVGWTKDIPALVIGDYIWATKANIKGSDETLLGKWSVPFRMTGVNGDNGIDGRGIQFIFKTTTGLVTPSTPTSTNADKNNADYVPTSQGWYDDAHGVDKINQYEYMSKRISINKVWTDFTMPVLWSSYSEDGRGQESIFTRRDSEVDLPAPTTTYEEDHKDDSIPTGQGFTDEPQGITSTIKAEYISIRKGSHNNWGKFSKPQLFSRFSTKGNDGVDGAGIEFIFKRFRTIPSDLSAPTTSSLEDHTNDFVPQGFTDNQQGVNKTDKYEYACKRVGKTNDWGKFSQLALWAVFTEDGSDGIDGSDGSDGKGLEFQYRRYDKIQNNIGLPASTVTGKATDGWTSPNWTDGATGVTRDLPVEYFSQRVKPQGANQVWSDWGMPRIFALFAEDGSDGKGLEYIYTRNNTGVAPIAPITTSLQDKTDDFVPSGWTDNATGTDQTHRYEFACKRTGFSGDTSTGKEGVWSKFGTPALWSKWSEDGNDGRDGNGVEFIFKRFTSKHNNLPAPTTTDLEDHTNDISDSLKAKGWTDDPTGVDADHKWEYMSKRTGVYGNWGKYSKPTLWVYEAVNGIDGIKGVDGTSIFWKGNAASHLLNPKNGWAYYNTTDGRSYTYRSGQWYQMTIDGRDGTDSTAFIWKGSSKNPPVNPKEGWTYRDTDNGIIYRFNSSGSWEVMVEDGADGDGRSIEVEYSINGTDWHDDYLDNDKWLRQRLSGDVEWGRAIKFVGDNGVDGKTTEFIYKRFTTKQDLLQPPYSGSVGRATDDFTPIGWTDNAQGITDVYKYEYVSKRIGSHNNWGEFGAPSVWAIRSNDGNDGSGVEFIFKRFNSRQDNLPAPTTTHAEDITNDYIPAGWSDNAKGTDNTYRFEYMSKRKGTRNNWGKFSKPVLWSYNGKDGATGQDGASVAFRGIFDINKTYHGTSALIESVRYNDNYYITKTTSGFFSGVNPSSTDKWTRIDDSFDIVATGLLLAEKATIDNLVVRELKTSDVGERITMNDSQDNSFKFYDNTGIERITINGHSGDDSATKVGIRISSSISQNSYISADGISTLYGKGQEMYALSAGRSSRATIVGLASCNVNGSTNFAAGLYGKAMNIGTSPSFAAYLEGDVKITGDIEGKIVIRRGSFVSHIDGDQKVRVSFPTACLGAMIGHNSSGYANHYFRIADVYDGGFICNRDNKINVSATCHYIAFGY